MLGQVKKVTLSGEPDDMASRDRPLLEDERQNMTDELLLAAAEIDYQEDIVRQREAGINHIQKDVTRINELFQDVAFHVSAQGEVLDHIEANVTSARDRTGQANQQLVAAHSRSPSTRKNLFCMLMILLLFVLIIGLIKFAAKVGLQPINSSAVLSRIFQI